MDGAKCTGCVTMPNKFRTMLDNELMLVEYLQDHGVLLKNKICDGCGSECKLTTIKERLFFRCRKTCTVLKNGRNVKITCDFVQSLWKDSYFGGSALLAKEIGLMIYYDMIGVPSIQSFVMRDLHLTAHTVVNWRNCLREVMLEWAVDQNCGKLGGPEMIVVLEECLVGKRKNNSSRIIKGQRVFISFEREGDKLYIEPVEDDNLKKDTLLQIIKRKIKDGSTIISHCWSLYRCLEDERFKQLAVSHSLHFVDPAESNWRDMKDRLPKYGRRNERFLGYMADYFFKTKYPLAEERFHHLFLAMGKLYNPSKNSEYIDNSIHFSDDDVKPVGLKGLAN